MRRSAGFELPAVGAIRERLGELYLERHGVASTPAGNDPWYMADLDAEVAECRRALVGALVVEIAVLHGGLTGRRAG